jgi:hypothetical protein
MTSAPFGTDTPDDYFDIHKQNKIEEIFEKNLGRKPTPKDYRAIEGNERRPATIDSVTSYTKAQTKQPIKYGARTFPAPKKR